MHYHGRYISSANDELMHYGVQGMKWGVRRYQNPDGTLTAEGKKRYGVNDTGWVSKDGQQQIKNDMLEERKNTGKTVPRPKIWTNNVQKGWRIEDRYKDYEFLKKQVNKNLKTGQSKVSIVVNKYGQMDIVDIDSNPLSDKGFYVVKNMDDVMKIVDLNDKRTK